MKIWSKGFDNAPEIDAFTVGKDRELDLVLAPWDILGTMAHITMLSEVGLLGKDELAQLLPELKKLHQEAVEGRFTIEGEDVHSEVEARLTAALGDVGKKVHTGRSRNDQVAVDIKLYTRARIEQTVGKVVKIFDLLQEKSEELKDVLMPGYTHLQVAMPSSFGLWLGAYAESLADDLVMLKAAWDVTDENPLGSAAGYGSSAPLKRARTTELLGFGALDYNSIYAQMSRGRGERMVAWAYSAVAETIGRLAYDGCLFSSQNFGFLHLPDAYTTGSSIMPQKKNPDVFELVRGHCNRIQGIPGTLRYITGNLPSGYFRDMQLLKEVYLPMFDELDSCLDILAFALPGITVTEGLMDNPLYAQAFCVEEVNRLVEAGVPFRDAYKQVGHAVQDGTFHYEDELHHTHEGSIGNLCNAEIKLKFQDRLAAFPFGRVAQAVENLIKNA
ncbi:MAG: argininosuccinate lyase [Bacteroidales bacterium]|nr:argininosuccinate lyase [Bacteroidales bacterium]